MRRREQFSRKEGREGGEGGGGGGGWLVRAAREGGEEAPTPALRVQLLALDPQPTPDGRQRGEVTVVFSKQGATSQALVSSWAKGDRAHAHLAPVRQPPGKLRVRVLVCQETGPRPRSRATCSTARTTDAP
jgi:hypothetical protein